MIKPKARAPGRRGSVNRPVFTADDQDVAALAVDVPEGMCFDHNNNLKY